MRAEVLSWCRREALFSPGAQVVCAVSGGADSMAMLCCLRELAAELSVYVRAAHFNHRLRGAESDGDEAFVRAFCAAEGIELVCGAPEKPARSEEEAREQRYAFLDSIPCDAVAIAHTAEDNLETLLQHLLRGSGLRGLGGIPPRRGRWPFPMRRRGNICARGVRAGARMRRTRRTAASATACATACCPCWQPRRRSCRCASRS